ncbi:hypothetical protein GCM10010193_51100 [Kitasatospora atroaurantiaca]|uniref:3-dehydroquinate synthase n=1 Tax=Kitasatospora atroaurantiaca TaxID=285545 RepID=A0A561EY29_9ACTN|nr:hypothetical protein [Kitasatospora atroaurantiaca]TWE20515.1 3-dehydroquinate synthase [Kitasatospora atroaurantiaca]
MAHSTDLDRVLQSGGAHYRLRVRSGDHAWDELARELAALDADRFVVLADGGVPPELLARVPAQVLRIPGACTLQTVELLAEQLLQAGATRRTVLLAVGGEQAGGVAGLLAGLLFQGLRLVHLPTTLAAMCGSALSLRHLLPSGVLGTHHAPELVWNQLDLLRARPVDELRSDLAELIRNVLAVCPAHYDRVAAILHPDARYGLRDLASFIAVCADARAAVTAYDPLERGPARVLEYGRTLGRGIGLLTALRPGCADGLGMLASARTAVHLGLLDAADERAHRELLLRNGSPVTLPRSVDLDALPSAVRLATARSGEPGLVLLRALGRPHCVGGDLLTRVDEDALRAGLEACRPAAAPRSRPALVLAPADR